MSTRERTGKNRQTIQTAAGSFGMTPIARAIVVMTLATGGLVGAAQAQQAFSAAWFANKGAVQSSAQATGYLPNGTKASSLLNAQTQQLVSERTAQSISRLNLAAQAIAAQQATQATARSAALSGASSIPDGLAEGGLKIDSNSLTAGWINAGAPTQSVADGRTTVTIEQTAGSALLNWETFNVGRNTTLAFKQQADWVVLNKVNDPRGLPSQIAGKITADGTVLIVNRNGIVFTGSSQINTRSLIASALPINDSLWNAGILYSNPDAKFSFSAYSETEAGSKGPTEAFDAPAASASTQKSSVVVDAGAIIATPTTSDHNGGRVVLIGPEVSNRGTIRTPDGQTILAAGQQVGLLPHSETDPLSGVVGSGSLRGLDVYVGSILAPTIGIFSPTVTGSFDKDALTGNASNSGIISTERGNISIAGANVNQTGVLQSTTSVAFNGRIDLQAVHSAMGLVSRFLAGATGTITLGAGSMMQVLPEYSSQELIGATDFMKQFLPISESAAERVIGASLAQKSQINITGKVVYLSENSRILAPGASVTVNAGNYLLDTVFDDTAFIYDAGQIYLDRGAMIDVSGSIVGAPVSENIIAVELRAAQLADSPLQLNSFLKGKTIYVDIRNTGLRADGSTWVGTPIADTSGYVGLITRTVGELTTGGGSVTLKTGGPVVTNAGSLVNVANGWIEYQGGLVNTTRLLAANGGIYDISRATPDLVYVGLAGEWTRNHPRWGVSETYKSPIIKGLAYQAGYLQAGDGGRVAIQSPAVVIAGSLQGSVVSGERQRSAPPTASAFTLSLQAADSAAVEKIVAPAVTQDVIFESGGDLRAVAAFDANALELDPDSLDAKAPIIVSPELVGQNGFGALSIDSSNGDIRIASALTGMTRGSLTLSGKNIAVNANVVMPSGLLSLTAVKLKPVSSDVPTDVYSNDEQSVGRGMVKLGTGVVLSSAGQIVNARDGAQANSPLAIDGGSISLSGLNLDLPSGSVIDVSSGIAIAANGKQTKGKGGTIALYGADWTFAPGLSRLFRLEAELRGYGTGTGGTLTIEAPRIQIGGSASALNTLLLSPEFFDHGGFSTFSLTGPLGLTVAAGTSIAPLVQSYALTQTADGRALTPTLLPAVQRSPVSLTLNAAGNKLLDPDVRADLTIAEGASIRLDPTQSGTASVDINGASSFAVTTILGSIVAPGGSISVGGSFDEDANIVLGSQSLLSTAGTTVLALADARGLRQGKVVNGGSIKLSGDIDAQAGSLIDVSGASGVIDLPSAASSLSRSHTPTALYSDAGSITFAGKNGLSLAATLRAAPGDPSAVGGQLTVSVSRYDGVVAPNLFVTQQLSDVDFKFDALGSTAPQFAIDSFASGGFDELTLDGNVKFVGPITAAARRAIAVATGGLMVADSAVSLSAPYVAVGQRYAAPLVDPKTGRPYLAGATATVILRDQLTPTIVMPTFGAGSLAINASLIDVGSLTTQTIGAVDLDAAGGEIRGYGTLAVSGDIALSADQVYPTSAAYFTIAAFNRTDAKGDTLPGSVTINSGAPRSLPLSAGGTLNIFANRIVQNGVLRAPLGTINLGSLTAQMGKDSEGTTQTFPITETLSLGTGSVTSVSAVDPASGDALLLPYGTEANGTAWIDPYGSDISVGGVPSKSITIAGTNVTIGAGATLDLSGGGDLFSNNWVKGLGGSKDILGSSSSFAIVPGYQAAYAPLVTLLTSAGTAQTGWSGLAVGDRVWLNASAGLAAGYYTLLPARYALLPGAFLVTKTNATGAVGVSVVKSDGSTVVSGYRGNALTQSQSALPGIFEVASSAVVKARAENNVYYANETLSASALANDAIVPRLPIDAGQLVLYATSTLDIKGRALMRAPSGGLGGLVDISSESAIVINATGSGAAAADTLYLSAPGLSAFGADSLLIGGTRSLTAKGLAVSVATPDITLANDAASVLSSPEIILASNGSLTLDDGSAIAQSGALSSASQTLLFGTAPAVGKPNTGSGNGALLRVSSDPAATMVRSDVIPGSSGAFAVGAGATISGNSIILDSTGSGQLDASASLSGAAVTLGSGKISVQLDDAGALQSSPGLVLSNALLDGLQRTIGALSLLSYSSIDLYGRGSIGFVDAAGRPLVDSLTLHAAGLRGFNTGGESVTFNARTLVIDNSPLGVAVTAVAGVNETPSGSLVFNAETIRVGANKLNVVGYDDLKLAASGGLLLTGSGELSTAGKLTLNVAEITAATAVAQTLKAGGALTVNAASGASSLTAGLDADLTLEGLSVDMNGVIRLPSGSVTLHASGSDVNVGGTIDVGGTAVSYFDQTAYTSGGKVVLSSDSGSVNVAAGSLVDVAAQPAAAGAGSLTVSAPKGVFSALGTFAGQAGAGGAGGKFILDVGRLPALSGLNATLNAGGFDTRTIRVRSGDVVADGVAKAAVFNLAADSGAITVTGTIDASGTTGGQIGLYAYNGVKLASGSRLTVAAEAFDAAGKGGAVDIETGQAKDINGVMTPGVGWIDLQAGSEIDLSVAGAANGLGGTLHLRAPQITAIPKNPDGSDNYSDPPIPTLVGSTAGGSDVAIKPLNGAIKGAASIVAEGFQVFDLTGSGGVIDSVARNNVIANASSFAANTAAITSRLLNGAKNSAFHVQPGEELVSRSDASATTPVGPVTLAAIGASVGNLVAGTVVTFGSGLPAGDTLVAAANGTLKMPAGMTGTLSFPAGGTFVLTTPTYLDLGTNTGFAMGGAANSNLVTTAIAGNFIKLSSGQYYTAPVSTTQTVPLLAAGDSATINIGTASSSTIRSNVAGQIVDSAGNVVKVLAAGTPATWLPAWNGAKIVLGGPGSLTLALAAGSTGGATITYNSTAGQTTAIPLPATAGTYSGILGTITALKSANKISGPFTLIGTAPISLTLAAGSSTTIAGATITGLPNGATFTATGAGALTLASGTVPVALGVSGATGTPTGDLTLPAYSSNSSGNWDLSSMRYGLDVNPLLAGSGEPGILTLRAAGNLVFLSALSDGFTAGTPTTITSTLLPAGSRSWSFRLVAGADLSGADFRELMPLTVTDASGASGSVQIGVPGTAATSDLTTKASTAAVSAGFVQTIRTGTGDIDIAAARDVQIRNQFSTIYTAGTRVTPGATANPGGSVKLAASVPVSFPNGASAGAVSADVDSVVTIVNPAPGLLLPAGTVYTFANGFANLLTSNQITVSALSTELTTEVRGAWIQTMPANAVIGGLRAGMKVYIGASFSEGDLIASSSGVVYSTVVDPVTGKPVPSVRPFNAGDFLPAVSGAASSNGSTLGYIVLDNDGTLKRSGDFVQLVLPAGNFSLTVPNTSSYFKFRYLPVGSSLRLVDAGKIDYAVTGTNNLLAKFVATVALAANASMALPANSSVTPSSNGWLTLAGTTTTQPVTDASGNTYVFDTPVTGSDGRNTLYPVTTPVSTPSYPATQYSSGGGNINIAAGNDIIHLKTAVLVDGVMVADDSSQQLPINWLYRRSSVSDGVFNRAYYGDMASTTWWVDYSNFFEGVGTLGGGNLTMRAGHDVKNVDGLVATNAWMSYQTVKADGSVDTLAANQKLTEYGGGNLIVAAGNDINAGVYYVEKGRGTLAAGGDITTNRTRSATLSAATTYSSNPLDWMATTLFIGKGSFDLSAGSDLLLGAVANPFLLPQGISNGTWARSYFSTYDAGDSVNLSSLSGHIVFKEARDGISPGTLNAWFKNVLSYSSSSSVSKTRPWLRLSELLAARKGLSGESYVNYSTNSVADSSYYDAAIGLMPANLTATAFSGDIRVGGTITLAPSPVGTVNLLAAGSIDGLQQVLPIDGASGLPYSIGTINLSDVDPDLIPSINAPMDLKYSASPLPVLPTDLAAMSPTQSLTEFAALFDETGTTNAPRPKQQSLHDSSLLHLNDPEPVRLYAGKGDVSGLQLFSAKRAQIFAGNDIADVAFYLQNLAATDISQIVAGRDIVPFNEYTKTRQAVALVVAADKVPAPSTGDISIGGPGALEVLAGRNLNLGVIPSDVGTANSFSYSGLGKGIVSIGNARNPYLAADNGASITAAAGLGSSSATGLPASGVASFVSAFLDPATAGAMADRYLPELGQRLGLAGASKERIWATLSEVSAEQKALYALDIFYLALRDAGRDHNSGEGSGYALGYQAIAALFPGDAWKGDITLTSREIKTSMGGDINLLVPGGKLLVGYDLEGTQPLDQGVMTLSRGNISIFSRGDVAVGTSRIFTFKGGNEIIWSTLGNIAAGSASKTLQSAAPTRYLIDPTTGTSSLDVGGLATGGGIGVLQTVRDAPPGDVDLIAPSGFIDAGDAGIRSSGNLNLAALVVLNADNIQVQGKSTGVPLTAVVNVAALTNASAAAAQASSAAQDVTQGERAAARKNLPSIFSVRVLGFGNETLDGGGPTPPAKSGLQSKAIPYDPINFVQLVGNGQDIKPEMLSRLTESERRLLRQER